MRSPRKPLLFPRAGRNRGKVPRIFGHRIADVGMGLEESTKFRMLTQISLVADQRRLVSQRARDSRMGTRELIPCLQALHVDVTGICGLEHDRGVALHDRAERVRFGFSPEPRLSRVLNVKAPARSF